MTTARQLLTEAQEHLLNSERRIRIVQDRRSHAPQDVMSAIRHAIAALYDAEHHIATSGDVHWDLVAAKAYVADALCLLRGEQCDSHREER